MALHKSFYITFATCQFDAISLMWRSCY